VSGKQDFDSLYPADDYERAAEALADAAADHLDPTRRRHESGPTLPDAWDLFTDAAEARLMQRAGRGNRDAAHTALLAWRMSQARRRPGIPLAEAIARPEDPET